MPTLYRASAVVDFATGRLEPDQSILVDGGRVVWVRPVDGEEDPGSDVDIVDASGTTALPGLVDCHSHLVLPGGAHWLERGDDPTSALHAYAEDNARLLHQAGVRWARDVGAPEREGRAVSLDVRDAWRGRAGYPHVRAAGCWLAREGAIPGETAVTVRDGEELVRAIHRQLDNGADLVKVYLDGSDPTEAPFDEADMRDAVAAAHGRGAKLTAHSSHLPGARVGAAAGVDALEHGFQLDADVAATMAANGVALVSTLAVLESWRSFSTTTNLDRFASPQGRAAIAARREWAQESVRLAHRAGVAIATGTDFGGGSLRANQLAWEVCSLVAAGLPPIDALAAATVNGGELLGEPEAGRLVEGGRADIVFVHGDPLTDPGALWRVWRTTW